MTSSRNDSPDPGAAPTAPPVTTASTSAAPHSFRKHGFLWRLGLHRPELRAWAMYDWANSAFVTTIMTAVFPIYYANVAGKGLSLDVAESRFTLSTTLGLAFIALLSPLLGVIADFLPIKKRLIGGFLAIGVTSVALMFFIGPGDLLLASILFVIASIAVNGSFVFYDAMLPHIADPEEMDRVSTAGYALGYIGGGILLAVQLTWIMHPEWFGLPEGTLPVRIAFVSVAIWWAVFSIPLFRRVGEPRIRQPATEPLPVVIRASFRQLAATLRELRQFRDAFIMLLAFLIYNDGVGTIIRMATAYGEEIGLKTGDMITALLIVQFVGIPASFAFGHVAGKVGTRRAIFAGLATYAVISVLGYFMTSALHFYVLAGLVGLVQGGVQALSRSLFASMIPRHKSSEFFGLFAVFEKFAGILGPALFAVAVAAFGSSRPAILSIIGFFVVGAALLARVDVAAGQRAVAEANREPS